jgi:glycosyltransferase involved in cell wall biosynthesis
MTIIGCMVAYQEATHIARALDALVRLCDRVIVVDGCREAFPPYNDSITSSDGTLAIAHEYGAEIVLPPGRAWADEVEQRNAYLLGAPDDWYLILDADEVLIGTLPDMTTPKGAYSVQVDDRGSVKRLPRLIREDGTLTYQNTHYGMYRQGRLLTDWQPTDAFTIANNTPRDEQRAERQAAFVRRQHAREYANRIGRQMPETLQPLPAIAYNYTGDGAGEYIPGIPQRDIRADELPLYGAQLAAHLRGGRVVYEVATC